ncbi:MAG: DUF711 family protein [Chloroflexi bacterium]|nr:MAG: DUF711 family protein [Chloroflexota bacterium]
MKIRSITIFEPLEWPLKATSLAGAARFLADARQRFSSAGFEVQTVRLATPPFMDVVGSPEPAGLVSFARQLEAAAGEAGIDYVSIGPVMADTPRASLAPIRALPKIIAATENIFSGVRLAHSKTGINLAAAREFAQVISDVAHATPNGFGNLRLAALANVPPGTPFFPAAYHGGQANAGFALATEAADLAVQAVQSAATPTEARARLVESIESAAARLLQTADALVDEHQLYFNGIDFSLAPYPADEASIAAAVEKLGVDVFGGSGTLFAVALLTSAIRQANLPHCGFSGVMLPVLEDSVLARRAAEGSFSINDLLLYSAVCGTGLDTIPIPGSTAPREMAAILIDMATLSVTLNKPLTARLMPMPGLAVGEKIGFDFEFFAASRVLPVKNLGEPTIMDREVFFPVRE